MQMYKGVCQGRTIFYSPYTEFAIQTAKGNALYQTHFLIVGDLERAVYWYHQLSVGVGCKKRLYMRESKNKPVLLRQER